jgi:serine/threonine protein kinase
MLLPGAARDEDKGHSRTPPGLSDGPRALSVAETRAESGFAEERTTSVVRRRLLPRGAMLGGDLEVLGLLGEGGMGQVYEAHDRALNRRVAVKVGWPDGGSNVLAEAQAMATIRHPGVVSIYTVGRHAGMDYAVMELIRGSNLAEHLIRRQSTTGSPMPVDDAVQLLLGVSDCLAAVHRAGMAHRDIKPPNILLAPGDRIVLTDFGVFQPEIYASKSKEAAGSPLYMAPESIRGSVHPGEAYLVDVYAFGVLAFELLTGDVPFSGGEVRRVFWQHLTHEPPRLSDRRPDATPRLTKLVAELLAKDPRSRPQSMEEIAWRLQHLGSPSSARHEARDLTRRSDPPPSRERPGTERR